MRVIRWTMMRAARTSLATGVASGAIVPCAPELEAIERAVLE